MAELDGRVIQVGDRWVLWCDDTGRHLPLGPDTAWLDDPPEPARARLRALGLLPGVPLAERIPARSRWALLLPDDPALWHALPLERTPGGFPFRAMPLDPTGLAVWRASNGSRTIGAIAASLGTTADAVHAAIRPWLAPEVQAAQLLDRPARAREPGLERLVAPDRPAHARTPDQYGPDGRTTLDAYHQAAIAGAAAQFDDRETTLAHALELPHPALGGRSWGAALHDALATADLLGTGPILEIGPGTGAVCAAFTEALPDRPYWRLDLAPALLADQERRCPGSRSIHGSATAIPIADGSVGLVLSNEVIADLEAGPDPGPWPIAPAPGQRRFNTGAFAMLAEVARVLAPGGAAYVSEFGALDEDPTETTHLDHPEVSIHFGQLAAVATHLGLRAEVVPIGRLLGIDRSARWLSRPSWEAVRALAHARGTRIEARAWTQESLPLLCPVEGLWWVPIAEPGPGPQLDRVLALIVRRP